MMCYLIGFHKTQGVPVIALLHNIVFNVEENIMSKKIKSFDPNIPKDEVDRLFRKLKDTRLPEQPIVPDAGWDYGTVDFITSLMN